MASDLSGYGAPPPTYPRDHPRAVLVLVLGILGIIFCMPIGVVAWVMANGVLREIDANPAMYGGRGTVVAGKVLGIIAVALVVLAFMIVVAVFAFGGVITSIYEHTCTNIGSTASSC